MWRRCLKPGCQIDKLVKGSNGDQPNKEGWSSQALLSGAEKILKAIAPIDPWGVECAPKVELKPLITFEYEVRTSWF